MCGIVGAVAQRQVSGILVEGLRRLEYRGYDSAGVALLGAQGRIECTKRTGKVAALSESLEAAPLDGVNKFRTTIGDGAFIGSNTALVAPVEVGRNATVGAGSVVTSAVPDEALAVARGKQRNIEGWNRPQKKP